MSDKPRLILHIGLHKTGTTWIQQEVFPYWDGVAYLGKPAPESFRHFSEALDCSTARIRLISDETLGGRLFHCFADEYSWLERWRDALVKIGDTYADKYDLGIFVSFRRPESFVLSIYKHYLRYGGVEDLDSFLGLRKNRRATMRIEDFHLVPRIEAVREVLGLEPFCFFLEECSDDPERLGRAMAAYVGVESAPNFNSGTVRNEGVNTLEAFVCRWGNRFGPNRGCVGKGNVRDFGTRAFDRVRRLTERGLLPRAGKLSLSKRARCLIEERLGDDVERAKEQIAESRGKNPLLQDSVEVARLSQLQSDHPAGV